MPLSCPRCQNMLDTPVDLHHGGEEFLCTQCHAMLRVTMTVEVIESGGHPARTPAGAARQPRIVAAFRGEASLEVVKELLLPVGFDIATATTGRDALHLIDQDDPVIAIVEDALPDLSGLDLCELLKRSKRHPDLKVLLVMGGRGSDEGLQETSMLYGPDAYIVRSALYKDLLDRVRLLMQLPSPERGGRSGAGQIDPDATRLMNDPRGQRPLPGR